MSERFYVNLPLCPGPFMLDGPEAHHLAAVSRLRPGDEVCLFNGDGHQYPARIIHAARREIELEILAVEAPARELAFALEVAAPLPKGDRSQFLIEKLTELGVTRFVPFISRFSNTHPRESKREKLERHVIEASKQCGRNGLMKIADLTDWASYCPGGDQEGLRVLAHPQAADDLASIANHLAGTKPVHVAVGPEGGFADEELTLAIQNGWKPVSLGPRILRVETAALVMAARFSLSTP